MSLKNLFFDEVRKFFGGRKHTLAQFRAVFGVSSVTAFFVYSFVVKYYNEIQPVYILWVLHFLKHYPTNSEASHYWDCDSKTYRKWLWKILFILFVYLDEVINLNKIVLIFCRLLYLIDSQMGTKELI